MNQYDRIYNILLEGPRLKRLAHAALGATIMSIGGPMRRPAPPVPEKPAPPKITQTTTQKKAKPPTVTKKLGDIKPLQRR